MSRAAHTFVRHASCVPVAVAPLKPGKSRAHARQSGRRARASSKFSNSLPKMTLQREESDADPAAESWQEEPPFPVVPERNFAAQRLTLYALLVAAIVLPCVYVAVTAFTDYH